MHVHSIFIGGCIYGVVLIWIFSPSHCLIWGPWSRWGGWSYHEGAAHLYCALSARARVAAASPVTPQSSRSVEASCLHWCLSHHSDVLGIWDSCIPCHWDTRICMRKSKTLPVSCFYWLSCPRWHTGMVLLKSNAVIMLFTLDVSSWKVLH